MKTPTNMSANWRDDEIWELMSVKANAKIQGMARDSVIYDQIMSVLFAS